MRGKAHRRRSHSAKRGGWGTKGGELGILDGGEGGRGGVP